MVGNLFSQSPEIQSPTKVKEANEKLQGCTATSDLVMLCNYQPLESFIDSMTQSENYSLCAAHCKERVQFNTSRQYSYCIYCTSATRATDIFTGTMLRLPQKKTTYSEETMLLVEASSLYIPKYIRYMQ